MIVEYSSPSIQSKRADAFRGSSPLRGGEVLQADPRCLSYDISQCFEEPIHFVVRIEWSSLDDHLEGFRKDLAFRNFFALMSVRYGTSRRCSTTRSGRRRRISGEGPAEFLRVGRRHEGHRFLHQCLLRPGGARRAAAVVSAGVSREHREKVTAWWTEVLGGPPAYSPIGGYPRMLAHHLGLNISVDQRRRFVALIRVAADDARLPDDPEFRPIIGYAEWGTRWLCTTPKTGATWSARRRAALGRGVGRIGLRAARNSGRKFS